MGKLIAIIIIVAVLGGGYYWWSTMDKDGGQVNVENESKPILTVRSDASLGDFLVAENGMTLYLYTKDTSGVTNCSGQCAINWPPYTVSNADALVGGAGVSGEIKTITRADNGTMQVTYKGVPLYFWKDDTKPGDTTGQNVGGVWFVVKP